MFVNVDYEDIVTRIGFKQIYMLNIQKQQGQMRQNLSFMSNLLQNKPPQYEKPIRPFSNREQCRTKQITFYLNTDPSQKECKNSLNRVFVHENSSNIQARPKKSKTAKNYSKKLHDIKHDEKIINNRSINLQIQGNNQQNHHKRIASCSPYPKENYKAYKTILKNKILRQKDRHPLIRSFIIKEHGQQKNSQMYNCDLQNNKFINMLNECLNKTAYTPLLISKSFQDSFNFQNKGSLNHVVQGKKSQLVKNKTFYDSFNNLKVKQSLEGGIKKRRAYKVQQQKSQKLNTNKKVGNIQKFYSINQDKTTNQPNIEISPEKTSPQNYSIMTDYNQENLKNIQENQSQLRPKLSQNLNEQVYYSGLQPKGNYNCYLLAMKRKKLKMNTKGKEFQIQSIKKDDSNRNSIYFSKDKKPISRKSSVNYSSYKSGKLDGSNSQFQSSSYSKMQIDGKNPQQKDIKIEDLNIFTNIKMHSPNKRKISVQTPSPAKTNKNLQETNEKTPNKEKISELRVTGSQGNGIINQKKQLFPIEDEQGYSCYLKTVNF